MLQYWTCIEYIIEIITLDGIVEMLLSGSGSVSSHVDEKKSVLRRATKQKSTTHVDLTVDDDTEVEIEMFSSNVVKIEEVKPEDVVVDVQVRHISTHGVSRVCNQPLKVLDY